MTLPAEKNLALLNARGFLLSLLDTRATPKVPREIRREARAVLKHYPSARDINAIDFAKIERRERA